MNAVTLAESIILAERYLRAARAAAIVLKQDAYHAGGKETAAAKRASMDLTRALAYVRRPG